MFEAIHGSAPRRANQNLANPSGLLLGAVLMLVHINQPEVAERVHNAWLRTIEDGVHTYDIYKEGVSTQKVGTKEFAQAVVARMGQKPKTLKAASYSRHAAEKPAAAEAAQPDPKRELVGVDLYVYWNSGKPDDLADCVKNAAGDGLELVSDRQPRREGLAAGHGGDVLHGRLRCRFQGANGGKVTQQQVLSLMGRVVSAGFDIVETQTLRNFDGKAGYTLAQGQ